MKLNPFSWLLAGALALVAVQAHAAGYVGLVQADGVTPVTATNPLSGNIAQVGGTALPAAVASVDGAANSGANVTLPVKTFGALFNGTTWDRLAGNTTGQAVLTGGLPASRWSFASATSGIVNTTTAVTIKTAAGAGVRNCITDLEIDHDTLGAVTEVAIRDGAAGTVIWRGKLQTTAAEGRSQNMATGICGTANTLMEVVTLTAVTGGVYVNAQGYVSP